MSIKQLSRDAVLVGLANHRIEFENRYGITKMGIFGSFARDQGRDDSDIDVVVEMRDPDILFMVHIKETLEKDFNRHVDVVRYRNKMNRHLKARIDREARYV